MTDARAALLAMAPGWDAEVGWALSALRRGTNLALMVDALQQHRFWSERYRMAHVRIAREKRLRLAERRRRGSPSVLHSSWMYDPAAGSPLSRLREWTHYLLRCARVPRDRAARLIDLAER